MNDKFDCNAANNYAAISDKELQTMNDEFDCNTANNYAAISDKELPNSEL